MTEHTLALAADFPAATQEDWLAQVNKALKGAPFDKKMVTRTHEGFVLQPLYTRLDWPGTDDPSGFPGGVPFTRGATAAGSAVSGWDVRQDVDHPDAAEANRLLLSDLERGATSVSLRLDMAGRLGLDPDAPAAAPLVGVDGVMIADLDDLDRALAGVYLDIAPVALQAGAAFEPAAALLGALWERRDVAPGKALGAFNADPLGTLARVGALPMSAERALERVGALAAHTAATWPKVTAVGVDGAPYHDGGASEIQTLAAMLATGIAYLRAMEKAGLDLGTAAGQIVFSIPMDADFFMGIAKLRALRRLWGRVLEACAVPEAERCVRVGATTARRMLSRRDPWVNMLRTTVAAFAGAVGGADSLTVAPFDSALGIPGDFSRRIARNVQILLQEESNVGRVIDPAGGSWYVETLTDHLTRDAWSRFQGIEEAGGLLAVLADGSWPARIEETWTGRAKAVATRRDALTGLNEFPNLKEAPVETVAVDLDALRAARCARLPADRAAAAEVADTGTAILAAARGATLGALSAALSDGEAACVVPVRPHTLGEDFEALRDAADAHKDKTGAWPGVFLVTLGPVSEHTGRATFARNLFEAGGIEGLPGGVLESDDEAVAAWKASGTSVAVLCATDERYATQAESLARALKAAGVGRLYLAGRPGEAADAWKAAGIDQYIFVGCDVLGTLRDLHAHLGLPVEGSTP
ncbi:methylmalonyl-CoA mutase family protein [Pararhodospirillum oryzae]|uniref:Methylmalonyl-CoA mutase n=1 Tax=Pararhodospirillum oryzae TaxID=478448 RepID=A0A512H5P6_9PROT|nr:methylmalonyl-CoA mutase family protein [Pararhodospirillum oryzae]GEO80795.1 methylmalonyl-CoA mutase [Pararhodospirillum oryzae]